MILGFSYTLPEARGLSGEPPAEIRHEAGELVHDLPEPVVESLATINALAPADGAETPDEGGEE